MQIRNDTQRYGAVAQLFHWAIVVLVITQFVLATRAHDLPTYSPARVNMLADHKSVGITILLLALLRLGWRSLNPVPPAPVTTPYWQHRAARISHLLLYALILVMPVLGWLMSSARGFSVSWFRVVTLPDFIGRNESAFELLHAAHATLAKVLALVAIVHAGAALKHHFIDRDNVLRRMLPVRLKPEPTPKT